MLRRALATALALASLAAAASGCSGSGSGAKDPLDDALGYLPKSAPLAVAVETDLKGAQWKSLTAIVKRFPFSGQIGNELKKSIVSQSGLDFDKDIKPLLGNELVIGVPDSQSLIGNGNHFVTALKVKNGGKLSDVLKRSKDLTREGAQNGATLYRENGGGYTAQKGDVVLASDNKAGIAAALSQRGKGDRLREDDFNGALGDLPRDALARSYLDLQSLVSRDPSAAQARKVKWIAALRTLGATGSADKDGITIDARLKTDPKGLTPADLPIATGDAAPPVAVQKGEIGLGLRDLSQLERFAESTAQAVSPASYGDFQRAKIQVGKQLHLNVDRDVIGQFEGSATVSIDPSGKFGVRSELKRPAAFKRTLAKLARVASTFAAGAGLRGARLKRSGDFYRLSGKGKTIYYGVVGKVFVAANDAKELARLPGASPKQVPGAKGAVTLSANAGAVASRVIQAASGGGLGGAFGGSLITAPLGDLEGWLSSDVSGMSAHLHQAIR